MSNLSRIQSLALAGIEILARRIASAGLLSRIETLVSDTSYVPTLTGPQKKRLVSETLADARGILQEELSRIPSWLVSLLIDIVVAQLKRRGLIL